MRIFKIIYQMVEKKKDSANYLLKKIKKIFEILYVIILLKSNEGMLC